MAVNVKTNSYTKELLERTNVYNPNLIINPDLYINQRGQSSYTYDKYSYCVDRWRIYNVNYDVNTKTLSCPTAAGNFIQTFETPLEGDHTLTFSLSNVTGKVVVTMNDSSNNWLNNTQVYDDEVHSLKYSGSSKISYIAIWLDPGASCTINWFKLEKGLVPTPYIEPDHILELEKCKYFYQIVLMDTLTCVVFSSTVYCTINGINMRKSVSATINTSSSYRNVRVVNGIVAAEMETNVISNSGYYNNNSINMQIRCNNKLSDQGGMLGSFTSFEIVLDAEIY